MKEYIVGVDFGHGETSAYVIPITNGRIPEDGESLNIRIGNTADERVCPSVVYCENSNNYSLLDGTGKKLISAFKGRISQLDDEKKNAFRAFIRCVFQRIIDNNNFLHCDNGDVNFYFCIACPTRWNKLDREEYVAFFNEALHSYNVSVLFMMNESDAAYFTNKSIINSNEPALVIDYGSSTIDYTLMKDFLKISDDSWSNQQLGANLIEKTLLMNYKDKSFENYNSAKTKTISLLRESHNEFMIENIDSRLEYCVREGKEFSYTKQDNDINLFYSFYKPTNCQELKSIRFNLEFYDFDTLITAYREEVRNDFLRLARNIDKKLSAPLTRIILSGGASIMPWVEKYVREIFPNASIDKDQHPSYVVAKGIANYAKAQLEALEILKSRLTQVNYEQIYEKADAIATRDATVKMFPPILNKIKGSNDLTGIEIYSEVAYFILGLNSSNATYCELFIENINDKIKQLIASEVEETILDIFHLNVDASDIEIDLDIPILNYKPEFFEEPNSKGTKKLINILESATGPHVFTDFDAEKPRTIYERTKIAAELNRQLTELNPFDTIEYDQMDMARIVKSLTQDTLNFAINLFHEKELFRTTYIQ